MMMMKKKKKKKKKMMKNSFMIGETVNQTKPNQK
jgi:hypothetical protein